MISKKTNSVLNINSLISWILQKSQFTYYGYDGLKIEVSTSEKQMEDLMKSVLREVVG
jgi:hypothetical protein